MTRFEQCSTDQILEYLIDFFFTYFKVFKYVSILKTRIRVTTTSTSETRVNFEIFTLDKCLELEKG